MLHLLVLALFAAAAGLALAGGISSGEPAAPTRPATEFNVPESGGYLRQPAVLATLPGIQVKQQRKQQQPEPAPTPAPTPTPEPTQEPTPEPTPESTPTPPPLYYTYVIQPGDALANVAAAYGVDPQYILWNNPEMGDDPDFLIAGQEILIPSVNGIVYRVKLGDTLSDVATFYGITVEDVVGFAANGLLSADSVIEGATLLLPGAEPPPPPPPPPPPTPTATPTATPKPEPTPDPDPETAPEPPPSPPPSTGAPLVWPFVGPISSYFGEPRGGGAYHQGLDIDGFGQQGAPVVAAAAGQVVLADTNPGYGHYVIIRHPDGSETLYAHLSGIWAAYGQFVEQGEAIGGVGNTGYTSGADGVHLHFEVRVGGVPVDPLQFLP